MGLEVNQIKSLQLELTYDLSHVSYLITSIQKFCSKNEIKFDYSSNIKNNLESVRLVNNEVRMTRQIPKKTTFLSIKLKKGKHILVVFDFDDSSKFFSMKGLTNADYYFKRTYVQQDINILQQKFNIKIYPLGMPFMVRPDEILQNKKLKLSFYFNRLRGLFKLDRNLLGRFQRGIKKANNDWNSFFSTRPLSDFENYNEPKNLKTLFYQKRFFPNENSGDTKAVHQQRVDIVRLLNSEFSAHFKGGIKDDQNLPSRFKDCASSIKGSQSEFLEIVKESGICIYTRGLSNSIGWTLPEFMSQGKAIIAEYQSVSFPKPLKHNVHLLYFNSNEELKTHIQYLLDKPDEIKRLSKNARQYYEENISPKIFFESILKQINA